MSMPEPAEGKVPVIRLDVDPSKRTADCHVCVEKFELSHEHAAALLGLALGNVISSSIVAATMDPGHVGFAVDHLLSTIRCHAMNQIGIVLSGKKKMVDLNNPLGGTGEKHHES